MLSEIFKQVNLKCSPWGLACAVTSTAGASFLGRYIFYIYPWIIWDCSVTKVVAESMPLTVSMSLYWFGLVPRWLTNRNLHPGEVRPKTGVSPLPGDVRAPCSEGSHRWLAHFTHPAALGSWQSQTSNFWKFVQEDVWGCGRHWWFCSRTVLRLLRTAAVTRTRAEQQCC